MATDPSLVSMKLPARDKKAEEKMYPSMASDEPEYPYGLCLCLEEDQLKALGITTMPAVGSSILVTAKASVSSVGEYESQDSGERRTLSLQITDLAFGRGTS